MPTVAILEQAQNNIKENEFINELIDKLTLFNIPQIIVEEIDNEGNHELYINSLTIAFIETCDDINKIDFNKVDRAMRFLITISDSTKDKCFENLQEIGESISHDAVTFIFRSNEADINQMFTIFPKIDGNTCKEVVDQPKHINTCINGTLDNDDIFPIKNPGNLNKCPFKVGMSTLFPFSTMKNKEKLKLYDRVDDIKGSDFEIMKIINEYFNATLEIYYIFKTEENPYSDVEFIPFVINGSLDACAGGIYRIYGDIVEYSGIYVSQGIFWVYYVEREDRSWQNLMHKLNDIYIFMIFYISYSIIWCLIRLFDGEAVSLMKTLLYCWGALVGASSLQDPRSRKQKFLTLMYLIMCIYLSAYVSMQFYAFLTITAPPHTFKTNSDVMESGRTAYLKDITKYFISDERYTRFANKSADCVSFLDCSEKTLLYNGLTVILQGFFYNFQAATAVNDEARILRATENILTVYNEMIIRKDSPLVEKFQKVMQRLFEAGITRRLFTEAIGISVVAKAKSANTNMISSSYSCQAGCSITLKQFAGVFYAWIFGCIISSVVFILEIFLKREKRLLTKIE
ncbi:uncharacterized protein LOC135118133 [Helicoverpa armigera]|uniref:uncharacterized protein LOC135118133 n=1 Tax=Helicoverpa armigera TaxID=29058 RepID=UPI0030828B6F